MSIRSRMNARRLDQRGTFQRDIGTTNSAGDVAPNWQDIIGSVPISVDGTSGRELALGGGIKGESGYTVWVRADIVTRFSIAVKDRILWNGRYLNITDIPDQQLRGRMMAIACTSGVNAG